MIARFAYRLGFLLTAMAAVAQPAAKPPAAPAGAFQISGTLVDSTNDQPLARARVAIAPVSDRSAVTAIVTSDDGRFAFRRLAAGKYTLTAQRRGYLTQSFNQHDQFSSSIAVGAGLESGDLVFRLAPEAAISGVITDEVGDPVRQAQVLLFQAGIAGGADGVRQRSRAMTDDEGAYRFGHLMPGRYLVAVSAKPWYAQPAVSPDAGGHQVFQPQGGAVTSHSREGSAPLPVDEKTAALDVAYPITFYPGATDPAAGAQLPLALGEKAIANVTLQPVPAAHFRVWRDEKAGQQRYPSLEVRLFDTTVSLQSEIQAESAGYVFISGVAPGHYSLKINDYSSGSMQNISTREVDVSANGDVETPQSSSRSPVTVSVQFEAGAAPTAQSAIRLYNKNTSEAFVERANSKGEFEFKSGVPAGTYELSITNSTGLFVKSISSSGVRPIGRTVEIKGSSPLTLALVVGLGQAQIKGVALRDDKPLGGVMVLLVPADPVHNQVLFRRDQSDSDGTFTLADVVPGKYTLLALENAWDLEWTKPAVLKPFLPQGEAITVLANGKQEFKLKVQLVPAPGSQP